MYPIERFGRYEPATRVSRFLTVALIFLVGGCVHVAAQSCAIQPCPVIASVSPAGITAGARQQRLVITGTNFIPSSRVMISIPNTDPPQAAPDVAVLSTQFVNNTTLIVTVDVNRLSSGIRAVDIINAPIGAFVPNTGNFPWGPTSGTTQTILISGADSMAGPLQVQNIIVSYPRDGTIIQQGDEVHGEAVLGGGGTGLVTGEWLWDGNVVEQFAANLVAGESTTLRTTNPLPSTYTGPHTLQIQVTSPQTMTSRLVQVAVNGGDWNVLRLLSPRLGAIHSGANGPVLLWTPVPGAAKYQIGFASQPSFDQVMEWHEVTDNTWKIPDRIWNKLPAGEIFWTVRSVDMSGEVRRPVPMRSLWHIPLGALEASRPTPRLSSKGSVLLEWNALPGKTFYLVTISSDPDGKDILRRYLTDISESDLYALQDQLKPAGTYYWQVQALSPNKRSMMVGPRQSFQVATARARLEITHPHLELASFSTSGVAPETVPKISRRSPAPGETIASEQPRCEISFEDTVDANKLSLSIDGVDVTSMAEVTSNAVKYSPVFPLDNGEHEVQVKLKPDSQDWKFTVAARSAKQEPPTTATAKSDAEVAPKSEGNTKASDEVGPEFKTHFGFDPQLGASPTRNQITMTGGEQTTFHRGGWKADFNGSGMFQALITPDPQRVFGRVQDYVGQLDYAHSAWDFGTRFGLLAPTMYLDSQFITTATPRQAVEPKVVTPGGAFSFYANTNDVNAGGGDVSSYHQLIRGAGYEAPLSTKWATFRVMWMNARDTGPLLNVTTTPPVVVSNGDPTHDVVLNSSNIIPPLASGDIYGGLLKLHLPAGLEISSEYAISQTSPDIARTSATQPVSCDLDPQQLPVTPGTYPVNCTAVRAGSRIFGRAWRSSLNWHWKKTKVDIAYRDVTPEFSNPANLSITPMGNPNRRGLDSSISQGTTIGDFEVGYHYLESNVFAQSQPSTVMHNLTWSWRKNLRTKTQLMVRGHDALTSSGDLPISLKGVDPVLLAEQGLNVNQRDIGFNSSLLQTAGPVNVSATISRDWFRNSVVFGQNAIVTGTQFGLNLRRVSFFQLQSSWSANWAMRDKSTQGATRILSVYLLPTVWVPRSPLSVSPLVSMTKTKGQLGSGLATADFLSSQAGGRVTWKLPAFLRHAAFSLEGSRVEIRDNLRLGVPGINFVDKRLAMLLSFAQDQTKGQL